MSAWWAAVAEYSSPSKVSWNVFRRKVRPLLIRSPLISNLFSVEREPRVRSMRLGVADASLTKQSITGASPGVPSLPSHGDFLNAVNDRALLNGQPFHVGGESQTG